VTNVREDFRKLFLESFLKNQDLRNSVVTEFSVSLVEQYFVALMRIPKMK